MGFIVGKGNVFGELIVCEDVEVYIFGMVLLNDWSVCDIQQWEYVLFGLFNLKGFVMMILLWIVMFDVFELFCVVQFEQLLQLFVYLWYVGKYVFDIVLEVMLCVEGVVEVMLICCMNFRYMYWMMVQQFVYYMVVGCNMCVGDLMGLGMISGLMKDLFGSLFELMWNGKELVVLNGGGSCMFIEDGDELMFVGWCQGDGYCVGFGMCVGRILLVWSV